MRWEVNVASSSTVHGCESATALLVPNDLEAIVLLLFILGSAQLPSGFPVVTGANQLKAILIDGARVLLLLLSFLNSDLLSMFLDLLDALTNFGGFFIAVLLGAFAMLRSVLDFEAVVGLDAGVVSVGTGASEVQFAAESGLYRALLLLDRRGRLLLGHGLARQHLRFFFGLFLGLRLFVQ